MARPINLPAIKNFALYIVYLIWLQIRQTTSLETMTPKLSLKSFIVPALKEDKYPNLVWYDSEKNLFVIKKRHAGNSDYSPKFDKIYKDWETAIPRKKTKTDMKRRLFEALKRSPSFMEVEDLSTKEDRVYQITHTTETRQRRRSTPKIRDVTAPSIHCLSPSFSEITQDSEASVDDSDQMSPASSVGGPLQWLLIPILPLGSPTDDAVETFQQIVPQSEAEGHHFHSWTLEGIQQSTECQAFLQEEAKSTGVGTSEGADSMDVCYSDTVALADHSLYLPDTIKQEMLSLDNSSAIGPSLDLHRDGDFGVIRDVSGVCVSNRGDDNLEESEQIRQTISSEENQQKLESLSLPEELLDFCTDFPVDSGIPVPDELDNINTFDLEEYLEGYSASQPLRQEQPLDDPLGCQDLGLSPDGRALDSSKDFEEMLNQ